jgi:hypothetical protein
LVASDSDIRANPSGFDHVLFDAVFQGKTAHNLYGRSNRRFDSATVATAVSGCSGAALDDAIIGTD